MATEKNITMKQFNGTDYDTLYPKTIASQIPDVYSKTDTITAETLTQLGLTADKLPNDAFQQIKTLIDNAQSSADSKARIQTGSYVGTGTYGVNNPNSLTFDFVPKFVIVVPEPESDNTVHTLVGIFIYGAEHTPYNYDGKKSSGPKSNLTVMGWGTNTLKWYNGGDSIRQLNDSPDVYVKKYNYVGLG